MPNTPGDIPKICLRYVCYIPQIIPKIMPLIYLRFALDWLEICILGYVKDMPEYVRNLPDICLT